MTKQSLLLVDGDTRSLRVLEVSLRKAGFTVTPASSVQDALDKLELDSPDLIISETTFPDGDGFELRRRVRSSPDWSEIPFVFLTASTAIENKIRGLELGVDDYLTKPIYIKEIITRINILLQKKQRTRFEERRDGRTRFAGRVADMPVIDVIQTIEISRKSGVIQFVGERGRQAAIFFRDGRVIDAEAGALQGEDAVYRLLTWSEGEFEVMFRTVRRREVITTSSQGLLMEGMRRLDEWSRMLEQLPSLTHRFEVDTAELSGRLGEVPDDNNRILRLLDGRRTLLEVIDASDCGDLECLQAIARLYFEDLLVDLDHGAPAKRDTGKPMPLVEIDEAPTPMEEVASGPHVADPLVGEEPSESAEPEPDVGPLLGGYRPSSLRLIDEAVAAAQAIEPSLFADDPPANGVNGAAAQDAAVPETIEADAQSQPRRTPPREAPEPVRQESSAPLRRDDSGLRMIGSLGRDRAEASGELVPIDAPSPATEEPQRELVTILPRRITREMPAVVAPGTTEVPASAFETRTPTGEHRAVEARTLTGEHRAPEARTLTGEHRVVPANRSVTPMFDRRGEVPRTVTGEIRALGGVDPRPDAPSNDELRAAHAAARASGEVRVGTARPGGSDPPSNAPMGELALRGRGPGEHAGATNGPVPARTTTPARGTAARTSGDASGAPRTDARTSDARGEVERPSGEIRGDSDPSRPGVGAARTSGEIRRDSDSSRAATARTSGEIRGDAPRTRGEMARGESGGPMRPGSSASVRTTGELRTDAARTSGEIRNETSGPTRPMATSEAGGSRTTGEVRTDAARTSGEIRGDVGGPRPGGSARARTSSDLRADAARARNNDDPRTNAKRTSGEIQARSEGEVRATTTGEMRVTAAVESPGATTDGPRVLPPRLDTARPVPHPPRPMLEGSGVRRRSGPGPRSIVLLCLAGICAAIALYIKVSKTPRHNQALSIFDAGVGDAEGTAPTPEPVPGSAASAPALDPAIEMVDAAVKVTAVTPDAAVSVTAVAPIDASVPIVGPPDVIPSDAGSEPSAETKVAQAKLLMEKAFAAIEGGDFQKAVALCDESLKLRRTARTLLLRAQALQKLDRVDDALASVSDANLVYLQSVKRDYPDGWELKGKILWAAGRFDDAKAAYEHFLELEPTGPAAAEARRRVNEPR